MPQSYGQSLMKLENNILPIPSFNKSDIVEKVKEFTPILKPDTSTRNTKISSSELQAKVIIYLMNYNRKYMIRNISKSLIYGIKFKSIIP